MAKTALKTSSFGHSVLILVGSMQSSVCKGLSSMITSVSSAY